MQLLLLCVLFCLMFICSMTVFTFYWIRECIKTHGCKPTHQSMLTEITEGTSYVVLWVIIASICSIILIGPTTIDEYVLGVFIGWETGIVIALLIFHPVAWIVRRRARSAKGISDQTV